jgi:predicted nucleic acid-binding protein
VILDTNVILRLLDGPDHPLYKRAAAILAEATTDGKRARVLDATIIEIAFVLRSRQTGYGLSTGEIAHTILELVDTAELDLERPSAIRKAAVDHRTTGFDFHDCYLAARARDDGERVGSLDGDLERLQR